RRRRTHLAVPSRQFLARRAGAELDHQDPRRRRRHPQGIAGGRRGPPPNCLWSRPKPPPPPPGEARPTHRNEAHRQLPNLRRHSVGDNGRSVYHALTLHNQVHVNHLPYMPFPQNWPVYIPKDKLANWFEAYVDAMELNAWTSVELESGSYDEAQGRWTVMLR